MNHQRALAPAAQHRCDHRGFWGRFGHNIAGLRAMLVVSLLVPNARASVQYVSMDSASPLPPYTNWATAARSIQDAVDVATAGGVILVSNGVYESGGRAISGQLTNRVAADKSLRIQSVNGPAVTIIRGYQVPGVTNGDGAVRCVYLADGAVLSGFTLTAGATWTNTGAELEQNGGGVWCQSASALVTNCTIEENSSWASGGGAYSGTLDHCTLRGNSAEWDGGGAYGCILNSCRLSGNSATCGFGGGACDCRLNHCTVAGNSAYVGGGVAAWEREADALFLTNCIVYYNNAVNAGPNYSGGIFQYCCTTPLPPSGAGNLSADPQLASLAHISAGSPCRGAGVPGLPVGTDLDGERWQNPPSIGCDEVYQGNEAGPLSVGLTASFTNISTGFEVPIRASIEGYAGANRWEFSDGVVLSNRLVVTRAWTAPGDREVVVRVYNQSYPAGIMAAVTVHVFQRPEYYVSEAGSNPVPPYNSWATAANHIQDAVDAATLPGSLVLVSNGTDASGTRLDPKEQLRARIVVDKPLRLQSINGPSAAVIDGGGSARCAFLGQGVTLAGFTVTNGSTPFEYDGGGVYCDSISAVLTNCILAGNSACGFGGGTRGGTLKNCRLLGNDCGYGGGGASYAVLDNCELIGNMADGGGGAFECTLNQCILANNHAGNGGGASGCTLNNCVISSNSANLWLGSGTSDCLLTNCTVAYNSGPVPGVSGGVLYNCIVYYNTNLEAFRSQNYEGASLNYCCTTPQPREGIGNFTNPPLFVNSGEGNLRLQLNSPCINAGWNAHAGGDCDLDGNPRVVGGTVDVGACEYQTPQSVISYAWLQQYGFPTDGSADFVDCDADGRNNWQEWICGTCPTDSASALRMVSVLSSGTNVTVTWASVIGVSYFLQRGANLNSPFSLLATDIVGQGGTTSYCATNTAGDTPLFYRVGVKSR